MAGLARLTGLTRAGALANPALGARMLSVSGANKIQDTQIAIRPGFNKIKEKQKLYAVDDGRRVHEKEGGKDRFLYHISTVIVIVGFVEWCRVTWTLAYPGWKTVLSKH